MLPAEELGGGLRGFPRAGALLELRGFFGLLLELRVTQKTLVFVKEVLLAVRSALVLKLRLAEPATVLVATVLAAPEAT